jgi:hypothetical protein
MPSECGEQAHCSTGITGDRDHARHVLGRRLDEGVRYRPAIERRPGRTQNRGEGCEASWTTRRSSWRQLWGPRLCGRSTSAFSPCSSGRDQHAGQLGYQLTRLCDALLFVWSDGIRQRATRRSRCWAGSIGSRSQADHGRCGELMKCTRAPQALRVLRVHDLQADRGEQVAAAVGQRFFGRDLLVQVWGAG